MPFSPEAYRTACQFSAHAHKGQTLPSGEPHFLRSVLVAAEVMAALQAVPGHDKDLAIQCALLHDIIEETPVTYGQIKNEFGSAVADGVLALTHDAGLPDEPPVRLQLLDTIRRVKKQSKEIWMVKMADQIVNLQPPSGHWPKGKAALYREESTAIYVALKEASPFLAARLKQKISASVKGV